MFNDTFIFFIYSRMTVHIYIYIIIFDFTWIHHKTLVKPCFCALNSRNSWYACYFFRIFFPGGESLFLAAENFPFTRPPYLNIVMETGPFIDALPNMVTFNNYINLYLMTRGHQTMWRFFCLKFLGDVFFSKEMFLGLVRQSLFSGLTVTVMVENRKTYLDPMGQIWVYLSNMITQL